MDAFATPTGGLTQPTHCAGSGVDLALPQRMDVRGPRYTSYPTAADFEDSVGSDTYAQRLSLLRNRDDAVSLYLHLPFCRTLCAYCGCAMLVRRQARDAWRYLRALASEMDLVQRTAGKRLRVTQLHFGGGTPNFLDNEQLTWLGETLRGHFELTDDCEIAMEIDPRLVTPAQIAGLRDLGVNRVSLGIQDFAPEVQAAINRVQPLEQVTRVVEDLRAAGMDAINFDLIYGLPHQTPDAFGATIDQVITLRPSRIAMYGFAWIPALKPHQRAIDEQSLPRGAARFDLYVQALTQLEATGYIHLGMDHFALPDDELNQARRSGSLQRNFQGYSVNKAPHLIGLGMTAIGMIDGLFVQNSKPYRSYLEAIESGTFAIDRGRDRSQDDLVRASLIETLMCELAADKAALGERFGIDFDNYFAPELAALQPLVADGLVLTEPTRILVTPRGQLFLRNIAMVFDSYRRTADPTQFSRTV